MAASRSRATTLVVFMLVATACTRPADADNEIPRTATPREVGTCDVSDLLVPACGAWLGVSAPSADGQYDYVRGLDEYESITDHEPDILHFYRRGDEVFPNSEHIALAERPGKKRSILYFNWKPAPELTWRQIADGAADPSIATVAQRLVDYPHRMFLTIQHEPEDDVRDEPGSGMTPADYVAMYRHVVTSLRALGVDNVVFVMGYMGFERWASIVDELYPGDDVVDWIAYDPYGFEGDDSFGAVLNKPNASGWPGFYEWATAKSPGTPIMLAEWGFDLPRDPGAADALDDATRTLQWDFPMIRALAYWNDSDEQVDARLGQSNENAVRFAAAYTTLTTDPYFNATPTYLSP